MLKLRLWNGNSLKKESIFPVELSKYTSVVDMPRKAKKIRFASEEYKSENVFMELPSSSRKNNYRKKKKLSTSDKDYEPSNISQKLKSRIPTPHKPRNTRKRKLVLSFSNESFEENVANNISPSKSETSSFPNVHKKPREQEPSVIEISSDSENTNDSFTLNHFFDTREHSLNESITEAHSGINYEFISNRVRNVSIFAKQICGNSDKESTNNGFITRLSEESNEAKDTDEFESERSIENREVSIQVDPNELNSTYPEEITPQFQQNCFNNIQNTFIEEAHNDSHMQNSISNEIPTAFIPDLPLPEKIAKYCEIDNEKCVLLKENCSLPFYGSFTLKVIHGNIEVLGHSMNKHSKEINLYSPRGSALMVIKNVSCEGEGEDSHENIPILKDNGIFKDFPVEKTTAIFVYKKLDDSSVKLTEKYISQQIFPKLEDNKAPQVIFEPKDDWNIVSTSPSWDEVLSRVNSSTKLLVTGGKGVGKSTFIKYAINRLLNNYGKIRMIDLDPGQPEFTVPGCTSVFIITEKVFGPNYTHLRKAKRSYLCDINVGNEPTKYLENHKTSDGRRDSLNIVSSAITFILPTDIIQISSKIFKKNFKKDLTVETVRENCGLFEDLSNVGFSLHKLMAMTDDNSGWTLEPRQAREMCVLSHLGQMM
ncbi:hypothetical protein JTB14_011983 [Gonioctena quinquepunctata]|nr:hypothetical protein JTB14_011983 [Gonioctena quinquepunctata]